MTYRDQAPWIFTACGRNRGLGFIKLRQGAAECFALVDSGAEINCIGPRLLPKLKYSPAPAQASRLKGIGGRSLVPQWVQARLTLENGADITCIFAETPILGSGAIVGLPFIFGVEAKIDLPQGLLHTRYGPVTLYSGIKTNWLGMCQLHSPEDSPCMQVLNEKLRDCALSPDETERLRELLVQYEGLWKGENRGETNVLRHQIELTTTRPLATRPRRYPPAQQRIIEEEVDAMLAQGVVQPSFSPYASDVVLVKKKTGEWRMCVDFRLLNSFTKDDRHPIPSIQDLLRAVRDSSHFVALDLRAGYWQIPMADESRQFTAFRTPRGLMEFRVMPFGLKNAPATFQRVMEAVLGSLHWDGVLVYLDDVLVHGTSPEATLNKLNAVMSRLQGAGLTINLAKCTFFPKRVKYLGFLLEDGTLRADPERVQALKQVKIERSRTGIRSFLGMVGFYRQFIDHYATKAEPLTRLLSKKVKLLWTEEQDTACRNLLEKLEEVVLINPLDGDRWQLETDASDLAVGAILSCSRDGATWRPVEFASKLLTHTQRRWPIYEREAWAIVWALGKFDSYLRGRSFIAYTDNSSLQWMGRATHGKVARWAARLAEYHIDIRHRSGAKMLHADFFSRHIDEHEEGLTDRMVWNSIIGEFPTVEEVLAAQKIAPPLWGKGYASRNNVTYYRGRIYVPPTLRPNIIACAHQLHPLMHSGARKTKTIILKAFNWPNLHQDVSEYLRGCLVCQRVRPGIERLQGHLQHHPEGEAFEKVYMDVWVGTVDRKQHKLLTMIDWATRWVEVMEITTESGEEVSRAFLCGWVARFGSPRVLVTDNAAAFSGELLQRLACVLRVRHLRTTPHHPQGNAPVESFHRTLNKGLAQFAQTAVRTLPFDEKIALILLGYRSAMHASLGDSPAFLTYGMDPRPAQALDWRLYRSPPEQERVRMLSLIRLEILSRAHLRDQLTREENKKTEGRTKFEIGDLVLLRLTERELQAATHQEGSIKVRPKWSLPFRVIRVGEKGQAAVLRGCVSDDRRRITIREAHIQNVRFISPPQTPEQRASWGEVVEQHLCKTVFDRQTRLDYLKEFWCRVEEPVEASAPRKRPCVRD